MIKSKRLVEMTKKWQKRASNRPISTENNHHHQQQDSKALVADKGHFVVYSADERRYVVPLEYLSSDVFRELFRMSEEEYGLPRNGPIKLPCDSMFMEYALLLVRRKLSKELQKSLLDSIDSARRSTSSFSQGIYNQQILHCF